MQVKQRNEIDSQFKWHLEDIFPTLDAWENGYLQQRKCSLKSQNTTEISKMMKQSLSVFFLAQRLNTNFHVFINLLVCTVMRTQEKQSIKA